MNTYKIEFLETHKFRVQDDTVNFKIYDSSDDPVLGLEALLTATGSASTPFTIAASIVEGHLDEYVLTIGVPGTLPESFIETVGVQYDTEDISVYNNTLSLLCPNSGLDTATYVGEERALTWTPGTLTFTDIADPTIAESTGATITGLSAGITTCTVTWIYNETLSTTTPNWTLGIAPPSTSTPEASVITTNSATLKVQVNSRDIQTGVTSVKFRYGDAATFDPDTATTYVEVNAAVDPTQEGVMGYIAEITDLDDNTDYAVQAVLVAFGNTYVDATEEFYEFTTLNVFEMSFDKDVVTLMDDASSNTVTVTLDEVAQGTYHYLWEALTTGIELTNETTATVTITSRTSLNDRSTIPVRCTVTDVDGEGVVTRTLIGTISVYVYKVGSVTLKVDESTSRFTTEPLFLNPLLTVDSITPSTGSTTVYTYDVENQTVTSITEGSGVIQVVYSDENLDTYTVDESVTVLNYFVAPTYEEIAANVIVKNTEKEILSAYPGYIYKKLNEGSAELPIVYCFKTNGDVFYWEYVIVALASDLVKFGLTYFTPEP